MTYLPSSDCVSKPVKNQVSLISDLFHGVLPSLALNRQGHGIQSLATLDSLHSRILQQHHKTTADSRESQSSQAMCFRIPESSLQMRKNRTASVVAVLKTACQGWYAHPSLRDKAGSSFWFQRVQRGSSSKPRYSAKEVRASIMIEWDAIENVNLPYTYLIDSAFPNYP